MNYNASQANHIALGPWGGQNGYQWDDGVYSGVRQVVISTSSIGVHRIQFEYDKKGYPVWSDSHGGNSGTRTDQIKFDYPTQYLVSISGYYGSSSERGPMIVQSLAFETNRKKYGPFGIERGTPFSVPVSGEMLLGFHGWSSNYLDSIGVYVKTHQQTKYLASPQRIPRDSGINKKVLSLGPWGGEGGMIFDDGVYTGVREVHITQSEGLVSIQVCYDQNGKMVWGNKHGGSNGSKLDKIVFDYPSEVLTHIAGYYGSTMMRGPTIIKSITFHTNKRTYGPFGDPHGFPFSSGSTGSYTIVGFHGRNGYCVHSIGVHVLESKQVSPQSYSYPGSYDMPKPPEVARWMPRQPETGPWGGLGGTPWDDGKYTGVKKIILTRGDVICSLQIQYDQHGHSVWSALHGIPNRACTYHIKFDYPNEVLTSISGYYDILIRDMQRMVVRSLTFHTNKATYGPYGKTLGTHFSSANREGKVVGFYGRSGAFLDAIGVHMQHRVRDELPHHQYPRFWKIYK